MDWPRHLRAWEALGMESINDTRLRIIEGKIKPDTVKPSIWEQIKEQDQLDSEDPPNAAE